MLDFTVKLTVSPYKHTREDVEKLRAVGFDDVGILQITMIASFFNYINRVADALGVGKPEQGDAVTVQSGSPATCASASSQN
jgi:uncharacterized protein YciW